MNLMQFICAILLLAIHYIFVKFLWLSDAWMTYHEETRSGVWRNYFLDVYAVAMVLRHIYTFVFPAFLLSFGFSSASKALWLPVIDIWLLHATLPYDLGTHWPILKALFDTFLLLLGRYLPIAGVLDNTLTELSRGLRRTGNRRFPNIIADHNDNDLNHANDNLQPNAQGNQADFGGENV
jgi:hypothetical protein